MGSTFSLRTAQLPRIVPLPAPFYQVAAVCYRRKGSQVEFLLVNTSSGRWTFPKGHVDPGMSESAAAAQEAREEAGAVGRIHDTHFQSYLHLSRHNEFPILAFLLKVEQWHEPVERFRRPSWFSPIEAKQRLSRMRHGKYATELHRVIDSAVGLLSSASR
jgi:8-oxo-dGTP pyrophosphatase MutT (NUDIX family)